MIPSRLNENNPKVKHYKKRIHDHYLMRIRYFWSPTMGGFEILKMWMCVEYIKNALNVNRSHWFYYITLKIRTESGDTFILRKEYLDRENIIAVGEMNTYDVQNVY